MRRRDYKKLALSVAVDLLGMIPSINFVMAPVSALVIYELYGKDYLAYLGFIEEAIPGVDIIPTATLGWLKYG